ALLALIAAVEVSSQSDALLKSAIGRSRPFVGDPRVHPSIGLPHDPSMPSGHAMNAFAGAVLLGAVVPPARCSAPASAQPRPGSSGAPSAACAPDGVRPLLVHNRLDVRDRPRARPR